MTSPIIARADALMQRNRRPPGDDEDIPLLTDAIDEEDDGLPLLIEVIGEEPPAVTPVPPCPAPAEGMFPTQAALASPFPETIAGPLPAGVATSASQPQARTELDPVFRDLLAGEVAARVEKRISELLPGIVADTVC